LCFDIEIGTFTEVFGIKPRDARGSIARLVSDNQASLYLPLTINSQLPRSNPQFVSFARPTFTSVRPLILDEISLIIVELPKSQPSIVFI